MATAAEISEYDTEELERQLGETRRELFNLRFQLATGQLDNFSRMNHVRKDVARMLTELRNREIAEAEGLALDQLPAHLAAARRRDEDEAMGRDKSTASERRAAARAEAEESVVDEAPDEAPDDDLADDEAVEDTETAEDTVDEAAEAADDTVDEDTEAADDTVDEAAEDVEEND